MKNVARYDKGQVRGEAELTPEGYIRANAVVTRTGVFHYKNFDGTIRRELRHPDDVWNADSIASMEMIPVTNNHPSEAIVNSENASRLAIGHTGETIKRDGEFVLANLVITHKDGVDAAMKFGRKELSLGYHVDVEDEEGVYKGEPYDARQRNIRYNHLALVDTARAGPEARLALDSQAGIEILKGVKPMSKRKIKIDEDNEIMVEESTADYIERLQSDLRNLNDEKARVEQREKDAKEELSRVESEIKMIQGKLEKSEAEKDSMKDKMNSKEEDEKEKEKEVSMDSESFRKAVAERVKLLEFAKLKLDSETISKLDLMSDEEVKKAVIQKCRKSISLDGKGSIYLDAMFDTILDENTVQKVNLDNVRHTHNKIDGAENNSLDARDKMIETQKNAHKAGSK
jgi:hypothetical protein